MSSYGKIPVPIKLTFSVLKTELPARRKVHGLRMKQERTAARGPQLGRWIFVAVLLAIGLTLYFIYAPTSEPPAPPAAHEGR